MNPYVSTNWMSATFMAFLVLLVIIKICRHRSFWKGIVGKVGLVVVCVTLVAAAAALQFEHGVFRARVWPVKGLFDQVIVTSAGNVFMKVNDPLGFGSRVQRYSCQGEFKAAFQPDNAGGLFKIGVNPDESLSIYSARTSTIDTFSADGTYLHRQQMDVNDKPFDFMESGPSVMSANGCEVLVDPATGKLSVKDNTATRPLEPGDWILVYVLNSRNIALLVLFGGLLWVFKLIRANRELTKRRA